MEESLHSTVTPQPKPVKRRVRNKMATQPKIGMTPLKMSEAELTRNFYNRKRLLTVPPEIERANPDKVFVYLDMNQLQKNGMWHPGGYTLYSVKEDSQNLHNSKFNKSIDGYIHRNELVLAYLPKEEYEQRQLEEKLARRQLKLENVITQNSDMRNLPHSQPTAELTREIISNWAQNQNR